VLPLCVDVVVNVLGAHGSQRLVGTTVAPSAGLDDGLDRSGTAIAVAASCSSKSAAAEPGRPGAIITMNAANHACNRALPMGMNQSIEICIRLYWFLLTEVPPSVTKGRFTVSNLLRISASGSRRRTRSGAVGLAHRPPQRKRAAPIPSATPRQASDARYRGSAPRLTPARCQSPSYRDQVVQTLPDHPSRCDAPRPALVVEIVP
jgi:hypothetical protein